MTKRMRKRQRNFAWALSSCEPIPTIRKVRNNALFETAGQALPAAFAPAALLSTAGCGWMAAASGEG
jgi:hypothetical protein